MKTKTTHPTKIGASTNTRNLFQKTFILIAILTLTSFGFKAKAQTITVDTYNSTGLLCDWTIDIQDAFNNSLTSVTSAGGSGLFSYNCITIGTPIPFYVIVTRGTCTATFTSSGGGNFTYSSVSPSCVPPSTSCAATIDCAGGAQSSPNCPTLGDYHLLIQIQ
jgi:hypothetical protein